MSEEDGTTTETNEEQEQQTATSAETENTDTGPAPVPYDRFKAVNSENKELKARLEKLEADQKKRERKELSEIERLQAEHAELQEQHEATVAAHNDLLLRQAFYDECDAQKFDFADSTARADAYKLAALDSVLSDGGVDDKALTAIVKALKKERPYLFEKAKLPEDNARVTHAGKTDDARIATVRTRFGIRGPN